MIFDGGQQSLWEGAPPRETGVSPGFFCRPGSGRRVCPPSPCRILPMLRKSVFSVFSVAVLIGCGGDVPPSTPPGGQGGSAPTSGGASSGGATVTSGGATSGGATTTSGGATTTSGGATTT